jgi:hypothetical protein
MTVVVDDPDSQDAASDAIAFREDYGSYLCRMADEDAAECGTDPDDADEPSDPCDGLYLMVTVASTDPEPEPPSPAAPALRLLPPSPCTLCRGYGVYPKHPAVCWLCGGSGVDPEPVASAPVSDRTEYLRRIGQTGGMTTLDRYGVNHYRAIGKAGYAVAVARHGKQFVDDILRAKGWTPRRPDLLSDLKAGRQLAEIDRIAA